MELDASMQAYRYTPNSPHTEECQRQLGCHQCQLLAQTAAVPPVERHPRGGQRHVAVDAAVCG